MQTNQFARKNAQGRALTWTCRILALCAAPVEYTMASRPVARHALSRARVATGALSFAVAALFGTALNARADAPPVLTPPSATTVLEDCGRTNLNFTVTDPDTSFFAVKVTASSSNTSLISSANLSVVGSGTTRQVGFTPSTNASGTATISLVADDGVNKVTNSFTVTVTAVNDAPVLGNLTSLTILEDAAPTNRTVIVTDVDTPIAFVTVTATSSNTNLVNTAMTGSATNRTLTLSPVTNANGSATITLVANDGALRVTNSFSLTITAVNDPPYMVPLTNLTILEDAAATNRTVIVTDVDSDITNVTVTATSSATNIATVSIAGATTNRTLTITPVADAAGNSTVTLVATDGDKSSTNSFVLTVSQVNDAPSFTLSTNLITVAEDNGAYSLTNFATNIVSGPANESSQTNNFLVSAASTNFFAVQPAISPTGTLTFRTATNVFGTNTITVVLHDSGGTTNGGVNVSAPQTFDIVVTPVNDPPVISGISAFSIREDTGSTNRNFMLTDVDTTIASITVTATSSDTNLFTVSTSGATTNRTLTITTVTNANGAATVTLVADDGTDTATNSFVVTVLAVNDPPSFALNTNLITVAEDSGDFVLANFATNMISGPSDESAQTNAFILTVTNASFYAVQPAISPTGTLTFRAATNAFGTNTVSVVLRDNGGTNNGGINTSAAQTFRVAVTAVNDAPVISGLASFAINEDAGVTNRTFTVTDVDTPMTNVTVIASSSDTNLVNVNVTGTTTNRTLSITTVTNANGAATITLIANDGTDTTTNSITLTVNAVNDAPVMLVLTNLTALEDFSPITRTVIVTDVDTDITNVTVSAISANTNLVTVAMTGTDTNRTLTLTSVTNANGNSTITIVADDGAKTTTNSFVLTVLPVNDAPSFTLSTNLITIAEDSGGFSSPAFATGISSGPSNESTQTNNFIVTTTSTNFFAVQPAISPLGTLTFRTATNVNGTNTITVVLHDSGGTTNSGVNLSASQTFDLVVTAVNDPPVISGIAAFAINEDVGTTNRAFVLTDVDTDITTVTVTATSSDTNLVTVATSGTTTNRTLAITTVTNANGTATITMIADDGSATSTNSFVLTVNAVNDAPSFTLSTNLITVAEDTGDFSQANFATNIVTGPADESAQTNYFVLTITNASFYAVQPTISPAGTLAFRAATNAFGTNTISVVIRDNGGTNNGGVNVSAAQTFRIAVSAVNDPPVISGLASFAINEDAGTTNRTFTLTDVDTPITNVTVTATSSDTNLINVNVTGTTTNRTLSVVTVTNANGSATITLVANDGTDTTTNSITLTVNAVNDPPYIQTLTNLTILEDAGATTRTVIVTDVDTDITNITVTAITSNTNLVTLGLTGTDTNKTLTLTTITNAFGTATISVVADDGAKTTTNSFTLTVSPVNDAPSFTLSTNLVTIAEDGGAYIGTAFATGISSGPANESTQTNNFILTTSNTNFFAVQPAISPLGTLTFRTATNVNGTNTITVVLHDSGGTTNGGVNLSASQTFDLVVTPVNDPPVISGIAAFTINEDAGVTNRAFILNDVDTDITTVTVSAASSDTNLVTVSTSGTTTNRTLVVTTVTNAFGSATITLIADDGSATSTNSFVLTVNPVNDAPSFTLTANNVTVTKYSTTMVFTNFATNMIAGPANESTQTWSFLVTAGNTNSFVVQPTITTNGTLSFRTKDIAGVATVSVRLQDNGGTANGGTNTSPAQTFTVTVPANPYLPLQGQYNGLFYETNGVLNASAGFMHMTVATNGNYAGYVLLSGGSNAFSGQFDIAGNTTATITRTNGDLGLVMAMDLTTNFTESATGTLSNGTWTAVLQVDHATFDASQNPAPFAGEYNIAFPGAADPSTEPGGNGYGRVSVDAGGVATLTGQLSDGTAVSQAVSVSKEGVWPLYLPLYSGKGLMLSWITFAMTSTNDLAGDATWIKDSTVGGTYYSGGFTNDLTITGSYYEEPPLGIPILNLTTGSVIISGGNMSAATTNTFTLNFDSSVTINPSPANGLTFTFDLANGTFSGQFIDTGNSVTNSFNGVVLQTGDEAVGYFLGSSESGSVIIK